MNIVDNNTGSTFYPLFVSGTGTAVSTLNIDSTTTPFSVNPNNGNITLATTLKIDGDKTALGLGAGLFSQGADSVAIGNLAGTSSQANRCVAIGVRAGANAQKQNAISVGADAGNSNQEDSCVAIGTAAGQNDQKFFSVAIGSAAGNSAQNFNSVAIGVNAARITQGSNSVAIGNLAAENTQGDNAVAIGNAAGQNTQGANAVAIGTSAGNTGQGENSVAIGAFAGSTGAAANSIILNGSGANLPSAAAGFFVKPVRNVSQTNALFYDASGGEITYAPPSAPAKAWLLTTSNFNDGKVYDSSNNILFGSSAPGAGNGYLTVGTSGGLSNSMLPTPNGWIDTTGRFYAPTAAQYLVNIFLYRNMVAFGGVILNQCDSSGNILVSRTAFKQTSSGDSINAGESYTCFLNMAVGDYFEATTDSNITIFYNAQLFTTVQVREL